MSGTGLGRVRWIALAFAIALAPRALRAQPASPPAGVAPWAEGVSEERKATAKTHLEAGNARFLEGQYSGALDQYRKALDAWDHPAIRFNIVRVLVNLGRNVEALENLDRALRFGAAPLEAQVYSEALTLRAALRSSIGEVVVTCRAPAGAQVSIDGQPVLTCPGEATRRVAPGSHQVVSNKPGYLTLTREQLVLGGKRARVAIAMVALTDAAVTRRRWAAWKPWAVAGSGALVAGMGGLLQLKAASDFDRYDREVADECGDPGCGPDNPLPSSTANLESRARLENRIAIGMMSVGGAALAGGLVLLWLNRPMTWIPSEGSRGGVQLAPGLGPGSASLDLSLRF
ncbi:MAG TPA: hypothetical protein VIG06_20895 [Kofleriaceae bacterium]|jgi:tetratricopeptide (TPR) repeat protein